MWGLSITLACFLIFATTSFGAELPPFHTSMLSDDVSISLTVRSITASVVEGYDYDVSIGLLEQRSNGRTVFTDYGSHDARVRCLPGTVYVGGKKYTPLPTNAGRDWKEDLVETLCAAPVS
ncbi:hypothetical protein [Rhizobium sp. 57MFTsu3.2]|uniref:hypothetical protein n=1 Tax=Rhizobium sp. 57MFTsu3.2 TaxID=1048681 RepID=UPI00146AD0FC|nr:hypothetical protein [Rhizobium sp. 57MFTsu3.2]NMN69473.1 hypothetical protein [Rhizobium sp. 57MFTsu3.2]